MEEQHQPQTFLPTCPAVRTWLLSGDQSKWSTRLRWPLRILRHFIVLTGESKETSSSFWDMEMTGVCEQWGCVSSEGVGAVRVCEQWGCVSSEGVGAVRVWAVRVCEQWGCGSSEGVWAVRVWICMYGCRCEIVSHPRLLFTKRFLAGVKCGLGYIYEACGPYVCVCYCWWRYSTFQDSNSRFMNLLSLKKLLTIHVGVSWFF